jgi:hypothetical protein
MQAIRHDLEADVLDGVLTQILGVTVDSKPKKKLKEATMENTGSSGDDATGAVCPRCYCWHSGAACPP